MESNANTDADKLITFGQMAFEQGWYDQAHDYFKQALDLDSSNREAMKELARVNEILSRRAATAVEPIEAEIREEPLSAERISSRLSSAREWIDKQREERAEKAAERERLAAEKREERAREIARQAEGVLMTAKGVEDVLELLEDKIRIRGATMLRRGTKEISLKNITAIKFEKAGRIFGGRIEFSHPGGLELFETGIGSCVVFNREQQPDFERIKAEIEKRIQAKSVPSAPSSDADEIAKLADLRDKGILTEEEFQQKKKQILGL
jgi:tetratricopeptide (TPR) repeat protein